MNFIVLMSSGVGPQWEYRFSTGSPKMAKEYMERSLTSDPCVREAHTVDLFCVEPEARIASWELNRVTILKEVA